MTRALATAAGAFEQALHGLGLTGGEAELGDPTELGHRAALLAAADTIWRRHLGTMLDGKAAQRLLGVTTRQAVNDLVKRRRLLAVSGPGGQLVYPAFQFASTGRPHAVLPRVLALLDQSGLDAHTMASWFVTRQPMLKETPAAWLGSGGDPEAVVEAARRAAARLGQ